MQLYLKPAITGKARGAFAALRNIWRSSKIGTETKLRIFKSNVLGVLLYGAESWKVSQSICHKIDVFKTRCFRRILRIFWPRTISNEDLYRRTNTAPLTVEIKKRRWRWLGHINRMTPNAIPRVAMRWTPVEKRKRGRPKTTWRQSMEKEMTEAGWTWSQIQRWSSDRQHWNSLVTALCATYNPGQKLLRRLRALLHFTPNSIILTIGCTIWERACSCTPPPLPPYSVLEDKSPFCLVPNPALIR